jgi:outer membrane receptor for ferrienterochelin and colicins
MQWNSRFRGGNQVYGESIYTSRYEILGKYQLPLDEKMSLQFSMVGHDQNSVYGTSVFLANQKIAFGQYLWDKELKNHSLLFGAGARFTWYNDNTPATATSSQTAIYSGFIQDDIRLSKQTGLLLGARYDYHQAHGSIVTPRLALKWKPTATDILRLNLGTGFRVVNLFTEDHQALSGAREVVLKGNLDPETSYTANLNYLKKFDTNTAGVITLEASTWYTHFKNRIIADYDTNPTQIIYANLDGFSRIFGSSISLDWVSPFGVKGTLGGSYFNPLTEQEGRRFVPLFTEKVSLSWALSYEIPNWFLSLDYTGSYTGSMRLPLLSSLDPRREYSLPYSIQNIQITYKKFHNLELFGGVKNLLNWTPNRGNPFLIARANDPFDKQVTFDSNGVAQPTPDNPYALTFDPTYAYGPNQGIRAFVGLRWHLD